jgi:hypothetical protein
VIQAITDWMSVYQPEATPTDVFVLLLLLLPAILFLAWILFVTVERRTLGPSAADTLTPHFGGLSRLLEFPSVRQMREEPAVADAAEH